MKDVGSAPTLSLEALAVGVELAERYEVRAWLGEGGMGTVYRVLDRELDEDVALKLLRPELSKAPDALVRFRREVKLARRVVHPNVARTYDLGSHAGQRFLTMELVSGGSLAQRVGRAPALPEILRIAAAVSSGLAASHAVGVVHRDLKPENILFSGERVVITDFGIARPLAEHDALATSGGIVGTPAYMAPEQLGREAIDGRADVFALGVVLFELLTGTLPFQGDTAFTTAAARLTTDAPDPRTLSPGVPEGVAELVLAMLSRRREARPDAQTAAQRIEALRGGRRNITLRETAATSLRPALVLVSALPEGAPGVHVAPFESDEAHAALAADLARAATDALMSERDVRLAAPGRAADFTFEGALRVSGGRARLRLRVLDAAGAALRAELVEGDTSDPFALEDAAAERARVMIRERVARPSGPAEGPRRERWEAARAHYEKFDLRNVRAAVAILEELLVEAPSDPWIMSALAGSLVRLWSLTGGSDSGLVTRAEELALRALDADRSIPDTYNAIGVIRMLAGDYRAAVHAAQQALARSPRYADAHYLLAHVLAGTGHAQEALERYDVALRLAPNMGVAHMERARTLALLGERRRAEEALTRAEAVVGPGGAVFLCMRLAIWWRDRAVAARAAKVLREHRTGAAWDAVLPLLEAYAAGEAPVKDETLFDAATSMPGGASQRAFVREIAAELLGESGMREAALRHVIAAAELPQFINLLWLDRCPSIDGVRDDPRFAEARAVVAARVTAIWD